MYVAAQKATDATHAKADDHICDVFPQTQVDSSNDEMFGIAEGLSEFNPELYVAAGVNVAPLWCQCRDVHP